MDLCIAIIIFVIGIFLIIKGGDWFVDSASWIAHAAKIPTFVIGATIVSFATTLPELIVSVMASIGDKNDLAVGNAMGTAIANIGLIIGVAFTFMTITTPRKNYWQHSLLLICSTITLWLGCLGNSLNIWASLILLLIYFTFISINLIQGRLDTNQKGKKPIEIEISPEENAKIKKEKKNKKIVFLKIFLFIIGAIFIIIGSNFLIKGGSTIANSLGIPERLIAISIVAIGTSLPELVTTIAAIRKKEGSLSIGNIIGANIINLTLILPICSLIANGSLLISNDSIFFDFPFCLILSLITTIPILIKQRTYKWQGIFILIIYFTYLTISIL